MKDKHKRQRWFDMVWQHFIAELHPLCGNEDVGPLYVMGELRCPIGLLAPQRVMDRITSKDRNGTQLGDLYHNVRVVEEWVGTTDHLKFLCRIQEAHDMAVNPHPDWETMDRQVWFAQQLRQLACDYGLATPPSFHHAPTQVAEA